MTSFITCRNGIFTKRQGTWYANKERPGNAAPAGRAKLADME